MAFSDAVHSELSIETGGFCANPDCRVVTGLFIPGHTRSSGDGAHIVAEKLDGPRGESPLIKHERAMATNGVWLCPNCHRIVDRLQPHNFSVDTLKQWKTTAQIWWQQSQGRPLQALASPNVRTQVARPSPTSLQGAERFYKAHLPLASALWTLRQQSSALDRFEVLIPQEVEHQMIMMSSSHQYGRSWRDEWATTFYCEDKELIDHMLGLIRCVDVIRHPSGPFTKEPRHVRFEPHDKLAEAIIAYIDVLNELGECVRRNMACRL